MDMKRRDFNKLMVAAAAGMVAGSQTVALAGDPDAGCPKHSCKGQNECKGKGGCKSSDHGCAGKNSCKGKGGCDPAHTYEKHAVRARMLKCQGG